MAEIAQLQLRKEKRPYVLYPNGSFKSEREFWDFRINDFSLWQICSGMGLDLISCLWLPQPAVQSLKRLLLEQPSDFADARCSLYICPECGDLGCGAISVQIVKQDDRIVWRDFAYQTNYDVNKPITLSEFESIDPVEFDAEEYRKLLLRFAVSPNG